MSGRSAARVIVFADIVRSTRLFEQYGNMRAQHLVGIVFDLLTGVTQQQGGTLIKTMGDEVMVTFEDLPRAFKAVCRMPTVIREDPVLAAVGMAIKVGLHYGDVVLRDADVFGDAVNVAARMTSLAKADQILTTRDTIACLPPEAPFALRTLGPIKVRGKQQAIEVVEVLWKPDLNQQTVSGRLPYRPSAQPRLILRYRGACVEIAQDHPPFRLGRDEQSDLVVYHELVSREHARIEFGNNQFVLIDCSTNGTYLGLGSADEPIFLHRDKIPLTTQGVISLGRDPAAGDEAMIRFECLS